MSVAWREISSLAIRHGNGTGSFGSAGVTGVELTVPNLVTVGGVNGASNEVFVADTTTDADGKYSMKVLAGTKYTLLVAQNDTWLFY